MTSAAPSAAVRTRLEAGLASLGLNPEADRVTALAAYIALLERWNRAFNLSAVRDPEAMVARHVLDSLASVAYLEGPRILDVGSGAGLPGIPVALCCPHLEVTLLDSNGKKTRFLQQAVATLPLPSTTVVRARVEDHRDPDGFNTVMARACAPLARLVGTAGHLVAPGGQLLALKGRFDAADEAAGLDAAWAHTVAPVTVPGLDAARSLVRVRRIAESSSGELHG